MKWLLALPQYFDACLGKFFAWGIKKCYQPLFSPDHGVTKKAFPFVGCRYYPTCSQYAVMVLEREGFLRGSLKALWRILRCNPWSKGGVEFPHPPGKKFGISKKCL